VRFGVFAACLAALLLVLVLTIPVPAFEYRNAPVGAARMIAHTCLSFPRDTSAWGSALPRTARLGLEDYPFLTEGPQRYRVEPLTVADRGLTAWWRPAGSDSVDLAFYPHTNLRLPVGPLLRGVGDTVVGRMGAWHHASLFDALFERADKGRVVPIPCPSDSTALAG
jgi:hypothetical protein